MWTTQKKHEIKSIEVIKNRKGAGIDGIPPEALTYGGEEISEFLLKLLNKILEAERIHTE